jgi:hypothetical protein
LVSKGWCKLSILTFDTLEKCKYKLIKKIKTLEIILDPSKITYLLIKNPSSLPMTKLVIFAEMNTTLKPGIKESSD